MNTPNLKLLLVEDNELLAEMEIEELEKNNYEVTWCKSLSEFEDKCNDDYLMIITDINLPDGDIFKSIKNLRMNCIDTPVVFQTGSPNVSYIKESFSLGAVDFLQKPFRIEDLSVLIQKYEMIKRLDESNPEMAQKARVHMKLANI